MIFHLCFRYNRRLKPLGILRRFRVYRCISPVLLILKLSVYLAPASIFPAIFVSISLSFPLTDNVIFQFSFKGLRYQHRHPPAVHSLLTHMETAFFSFPNSMLSLSFERSMVALLISGCTVALIPVNELPSHCSDSAPVLPANGGIEDCR